MINLSNCKDENNTVSVFNSYIKVGEDGAFFNDIINRCEILSYPFYISLHPSLYYYGVNQRGQLLK